MFVWNNHESGLRMILKLIFCLLLLCYERLDLAFIAHLIRFLTYWRLNSRYSYLIIAIVRFFHLRKIWILVFYRDQPSPRDKAKIRVRYLLLDFGLRIIPFSKLNGLKWVAENFRRILIEDFLWPPIRTLLFQFLAYVAHWWRVWAPWFFKSYNLRSIHYLKCFRSHWQAPSMIA